jgi:phospholipase C
MAACSGALRPSSFDFAPYGRSAQDDWSMHRASTSSRKTPIKHVVFIIQENRSFNNLFMGYPGAATQNYGYDERRRKISLHAQGLITGWDIDHYSTAFFTDCDGQGTLPGTHCKLDGWDHEAAGNGHPKDFAYAYVPRDEIEPYWTMAKQYVLADRMFASNLDGSFIAHQYVVAAYASHAVNYPLSRWGCEGGKADTLPTLLANRTDGPSIRACFENPTIGGEADAAGVSWRFYADALEGTGGLWSSYQADRKIFRHPDWRTDVISPPSQFLTDIGNGELANITWITPTFPDSDHPGFGSTEDGPAWVASLVDAIGESPFWKSTAIFIMWDDWGGWFDPVQPVYEDYDGLGFRVPLIVVSPYAKRDSVTHTQYETASVLRFIEDNFGLSHLAASDKRANDPADDPAVFDYEQQPRKFREISGSKPDAYWTHAARTPSARSIRDHIIGDD